MHFSNQRVRESSVKLQTHKWYGTRRKQTMLFMFITETTQSVSCSVCTVLLAMMFWRSKHKNELISDAREAFLDQCEVTKFLIFAFFMRKAWGLMLFFTIKYIQSPFRWKNKVGRYGIFSSLLFADLLQICNWPALPILTTKIQRF